MNNHELSSSLSENPLETGNGLTPPNTHELELTLWVSQDHLASEKPIKLVYWNIAFDERSFPIDVPTFAP